jgi:hypothetical protein
MVNVSYNNGQCIMNKRTFQDVFYRKANSFYPHRMAKMGTLWAGNVDN